MLKPKFADLSRALSSGFFADNAVLVLSKVKKGTALTAEDRKILEEIVNFLNAALEGFGWSEKPQFSTHSAMSAVAFSQAAQVIIAGDAGTFSRTLRGYLNLLKKLQANQKVPAEGLQKLINFFTDVGKAQLKDTNDIINTQTSLGSRRIFSAR